MGRCYGRGDEVFVERLDKELVKLPAAKRAIGCKWVYKKKPPVSKKEREKFKARLVAKRHSKKKRIDYDEIFSPIVRHTSIRVVIALVASQDMHWKKMDVKTTLTQVT